MIPDKKRIVVLFTLMLVLGGFSWATTGFDVDAHPGNTGSRTGATGNQPDSGFSEGTEIVEIYHADGTHNTSFTLGETVYINITTTLVVVPNEKKVKVFDYLGNKLLDIVDFFTLVGGGPPYNWTGSFDANTANGFTNDHYLVEIRLKEGGGGGAKLITFDTIEVGGGANPPKYIKTFSDAAYTTRSHTFTKDQMIYVEAYCGGATPDPVESRIELADFQENQHEPLDDSYTVNGNYARFSYDLNQSGIGLIEDYWYTINAKDLKDVAKQSLLKNWVAQIMIVHHQFVNIPWATTLNSTDQLEQEFYSGDEVIVRATALHNIDSSKIDGMNMTVSSPSGSILIEDRSMDLDGIDPGIPPLWKNFSSSFDLPIPSPRGIYHVNLTVMAQGPIENFTELQFTVLNSIPWADDISLNLTSSLRNRTVGLSFNGTDIEEDEWNLTPYLEYRDPSEVTWNTTYLSNLTYDNDEWTADLVIPMDAPLGLYDLKVRFNDSDGDLSEWLYLNDSLSVVNDGPNIVDIKSTNSEIFRTETISLFVNASDVETGEPDLDIGLHYRSPTGDWTNLTPSYTSTEERWKADLTPAITAGLGQYSLRAQATDADGNHSPWSEAVNLFEVKNNLPAISEDLDNITVKTKIVNVDLGAFGSDVEDDEINLTWSLDPDSVDTSLFTAEISNVTNDTLSITPVDGALGEDEITLTLTDKDGGNVSKADVLVTVNATVPPLPKPPKVSLLSPANGTTINTTTPELKWSVDHSGSETVKYDIYLDSISDPRTVVSQGQTGTSYTVKEALKDGQIYYWKVLPYTDTMDGNLSRVWAFTVDLGFQPIYGVDLTLDHIFISTEPGKSGAVKLTVRNFGNVMDDFALTFTSVEFDPSDIQLSVNSVSLRPEVSSDVTVIITVPEDMKPGNYKVTFSASSDHAADSIDLTIEVPEKEEPDGSDLISSPFLWLSIIIIGIVAVGVGIVAAKRRKKEEEPPPEKWARRKAKTKAKAKTKGVTGVAKGPSSTKPDAPRPKPSSKKKKKKKKKKKAPVAPAKPRKQTIGKEAEGALLVVPWECPTCGEGIEPESEVCPNCNTELDEIPSPTEKELGPEGSEIPDEAPAPSSTVPEEPTSEALEEPPEGSADPSEPTEDPEKDKTTLSQEVEDKALEEKEGRTSNSKKDLESILAKLKDSGKGS